MTQEEKSLLLKDLCARLPYGIKALYTSYGYKRAKKDFVCSLIEIKVIDDKSVIRCSDYHLLFYIHEKDLETLKPYLRPMSSMTEEENEEYRNIDNRSYSCPIDYAHVPASDRIDWLNKHHFDYRGLIEKGLALEAPEGMYDKKGE